MTFALYMQPDQSPRSARLYSPQVPASCTAANLARQASFDAFTADCAAMGECTRSRVAWRRTIALGVVCGLVAGVCAMFGEAAHAEPVSAPSAVYEQIDRMNVAERGTLDGQAFDELTVTRSISVAEMPRNPRTAAYGICGVTVNRAQFVAVALVVPGHAPVINYAKPAARLVAARLACPLWQAPAWSH